MNDVSVTLYFVPRQTDPVYPPANFTKAILKDLNAITVRQIDGMRARWKGRERAKLLKFRDRQRKLRQTR